MLEHSRAQAALVSGALLPTLRAAMAKGRHEIRSIHRFADPKAIRVKARCRWNRACSRRRHRPRRPPPTPTTPVSGSIPPAPPAGPRARCTPMPIPTGPASSMASGVLGIREDDVCFSAAKLFFAYGLGNALTFPLSVGATTVLLAERPTPDVVFKRLIDHQPTLFFGAPTGYAGMLAAPDLPAPEQLSLRLAVVGRRSLAGGPGQRFSAHFGVDIIDGIGSTEMLHIFLSNVPGKVRYGIDRLAGAGLRHRVARRRRPARRRRRDRRSVRPRPERGADVLGQSRQVPRHLPGRVDQERRQVRAQRGRQLYLFRPQRRHAEGQRHVRLAVRGRGHAGASIPRCWNRP